MWRGAALGGGVAVAAAGACGVAEPICTDRPGKGSSTCAVPMGQWQIETGLADWPTTRGSSSSDFTVFGSTLIKYGISGRADVELGITPFQSFRVRGDGSASMNSGFGDMSSREIPADRRRCAGRGGNRSVREAPDRHRRIGNGKVEAGLTVPVSAALGSSSGEPGT